MEKIAIFGGTFDPVHSEHIRLCHTAIEQLKLDKLIIMPTFTPPHKESAVSSDKHRFNMLKLAFAGNKKCEVSDYELKKGGVSYTYQTMEYFKKQFNAKLYFIVGLDMLYDFKTWKNPERILSACDLVAFGREGYYTDIEATRQYFLKNFGKDFIQLNYEGKNVSSTKIRVYSSLNLDITGLADESVVKYIKENELYAPNEITRFLIKNLTTKRLIHTANVATLSMEKVKSLNLSRSKVLTASLLHDCAKYLKKEDFPFFKIDNDVPKPVEHAFLGAYVAKAVLNMLDEEVLDAICYHTSGKANMSTLSKLIFVADMLEEGREYEGVDELRRLYKKDFNECFLACLSEEFLHLKNKGQPIYRETINAVNFYLNK